MYQWRKGIVRWQVGKTLYLSVPFTWLLPEAELIAKQHKGKVIAGGPAVKLMGAEDWAETPDECPYDTLAMHNPLATFTTRGCPNRCQFCAVPKIEGGFRELESWKPAPVVCDNNILASSKKHFERVIDSLMPFPYADFNQGLEARRFTAWHADQLAKLDRVMVRFAFDSVKAERPLAAALEIARNAGLRDFRVYVLIGFKDTPEDALYRLEWVRQQKIFTTAMRYQPIDCLRKDSYVGAGWTARELRRMARYYNRLTWLGHVRYNEFRAAGDPNQLEFATAKPEED